MAKKPRRKAFIVPDDLMIPLGAKATRELGKCCDNWTSSEILLLRAELPVAYHAVPADELKMRWINIRKQATPGYRLHGHGPTKGSRKHNRVIPDQYKAYLNSPEWRAKRIRWLNWWKSCCICNDDSLLDVHHRSYENIPNESFRDCVVLCRKCHELFHDVIGKVVKSGKLDGLHQTIFSLGDDEEWA